MRAVKEKIVRRSGFKDCIDSRKEHTTNRTNGFNVFGVRKNDTARRVEDIEDGNPILAGRLHTNVAAVVVG